VTDEPGDYVVLSMPVKTEGTYELSVYMTTADDYGQLQFVLNGEPVGEIYDGYDTSVLSSGRLSLGEVHLHKDANQFKFLVVGKNEASENYYFGVDCFVLRRVSAESGGIER
jgi:hypothetical protein